MQRDMRAGVRWQCLSLFHKPLCAIWNCLLLCGHVGFSPVPIPGRQENKRDRPAKNELLQNESAWREANRPARDRFRPEPGTSCTSSALLFRQGNDGA